MKKLVVLIIALLMCLLTALLVNPTITYIESDGYMVTTDANIATSLSSGEGENIALYELSIDDMIYTTLFNSYDYANKTSLDMDYPMYTNNGATIYFLTGSNWLVSNEFDVLETYENLYMSNGNTYNQDLSQADADEFILVSLSNGLYMNAQAGVFTNQLYETVIPANSIIKFEDDQLSFYSYVNGELVYTFIGEVYGSTISIGDNTYEYITFLDALGLLEEAISNIESNKDADDILDEIRDNLGIEKEVPVLSGNGGSGSNSGDSDEDAADDLLEGGLDGDGSDSESSTENSDVTEGDTDLESGAEDDSDASDGNQSNNDAAGEDGDVDSDTDSSASDGVLSDGDPAEGDGGVGEEGDGFDSGESPEPEYQEPEIGLEDLSSWAYAINGTLSYSDPSSTIRKGVAVTVYAKLTGTGSSSVDEDGNEYYSSDTYKASSAQLRKTFYSGQEITLDGLEPGEEFYIQYTYTYTKEVEDEETGVKTYTSISVVSDFYVISTLDIDECELPTILMSFDTEFATYSDRMELTSVYVENDSAYDESADGFDNFILNVLPYINKIIFEIDGEDPITITSSTIKKAMLEGGVDFTSAANTLSSNGIHNYTITAEDKYGNQLDLSVNGNDACTGTVYTAKKKPTIEIETIENITDSLTIEITVNDTDGALEKVNGVAVDLELLVTNTAGESTYLSGVYGDGISFSSDSGTNILKLSEPEDGKTYTLTIDSLAFARTYTFSVFGNYAAQPDNVTAYAIDVDEDELFGSEKIYTASMGSGYVDVEMETIATTDTGASVGFTVTNNSETEILALLDEIRITITDTESNDEKAYVILEESELSQIKLGDEGYLYDPVTESVIISSESGITISLKGPESYFSGKTLWEALLVQMITDGDTESYTTAVQVVVTIADGALETYTAHQITYEAMVVKSGVEYSIQTVLSNTKFQTKKKEPTVVMDDSFVANDVIEFINMDVIDEDGAITGVGAVEVHLYQGDTLLQKKTFYVSDDPQNIRFEGLTTGIYYTVQVVALAYNNDTGYSAYQAQYVLESYEIEAGSDIKAEITLNYLEYIYNNRTTEAFFTVTGAYCEEMISGTLAGTVTGYDRWSSYTNNGVITGKYTEYFNLEEIGANDYDVIEVEYQPDSGIYDSTQYFSAINVYFYDASYASVKVDDATVAASVSYSSGATMAFVIPDGAVYVRFILGDVDYLEENGFSLYGYSFDDDTLGLTVSLKANDTTESSAVINIDGEAVEAEDYILSNSSVSSTATGALVTNTSYRMIYQLPVTPGDVYVTDLNTAYGYVLLYNSDGEYVGCEGTWGECVLFVVPENVYYISFAVNNTYNFDVYKIATAQNGDAGVQYELSADIYVYDKSQYLFDDGVSTVWYTLEQSEVMNAEEEDYEVVHSSSTIDLVEVEDGGYSATVTYEDQLDPNCTYRISVRAYYQGEEIVLTTQELQTDGTYRFINTAADFAELYRYPYSNFLVTSDITVSYSNSFTFYGTLDCDGHKITSSDDDYLFNTIGPSGVVKNMVYEIDNGILHPIAYYNYGTIDNVIVQSVGYVESLASYRAFIAYANYGTIQNFIVALGGDVYLDDSYTGIVTAQNLGGTIQDGYVYTASGASVIYEGEVAYRGGITAISWRDSIISNVYTVYDTYIEVFDSSTTSFGFVLGSNGTAGTVTDSYHVGDFYEYDDGKTTTLSTTRYVTNRSWNTGTYDNVWHVTSNEYLPYNSYDFTETASVPMVSEVTWQSSVLGDAFDVEGTVSMGYYPRLNLTTCMQQYQAYRTLPLVTQESVPVIVWDGFTEGTTVYDASGTISLYMENPMSYAITAVSIPGLTTTVSSQGTTDGNLYEVVLTVSVSSDDLVAEYSSAYAVESFTYSNGGISKTVAGEYTTENIEFYKTVSSVTDWININNNMDWNYRLTSNIIFGSYDSIGGIMINGSTSNTTSTGQFSGKIDGAGYTISGIELINVERAYVIYYMASGAEIRDLYIDGLTISATTTQYGSYVGFIRYSYRNVTIDGVHISNASITGSGYVGVLGAYLQAQIYNCTVNNATVTLKTSTYDVYMGGLTGMANMCTISNCYVRDVTLTAYDVNSCIGIGGLVGYQYYTDISDCYATGTINSDGVNLGGITGKNEGSNSAIENVISDVDINSITSYVGGIIGYSIGPVQYSLALGDISAGTTNIGRVAGYSTTSYENYYRPNYAYEGQVVNLLTAEDNDDARELFSTAELMQRSTWLDDMRFSTSQWDLSGISSAELPKLYYKDSTTLLPGQEDGISLPGGESLSVEILNGDVLSTSTGTGGTTYYYADILVTDESMSASELMTAISAGEITFTIEGMDMTDASGYEYTMEEYVNEGSSNAVRIMIKTYAFTNAYDSYKVIVTDTSSGLTTSALLDYGEPLYFTVANLSDWNYYMTSGHDRTVENFKITGTVDFLGANPSVNDLMLGSIVGEGDDAAFTNINYATSSTDGGNWITSCNGITGVDFINCTATISTAPVYQTMATLIGMCNGDLSDLSITDITITTNNSYGGGTGLIYQINGNVTNIVVDNVYIKQEVKTTSTRSYTGGIAGYLTGFYSDITATNVTIDCQRMNYVGGLFGYVYGLSTDSTPIYAENITVDNISINGDSILGSIIGRLYYGYQLQNITATNVSVTAEGHAGGIMAYATFTTTGSTNNNISITNGTVKSTDDSNTYSDTTGGLFGYLYYNGILYDVIVEDVTVEGYGRVGGIAGATETSGIIGAEVIGCNITQYTSVTDNYDQTIGAGGVAGYWIYTSNALQNIVIRDTTISSDYNAGGLIGYVYNAYRPTLNNIYIAEDVSISATYDNAGGLIGRTTRFIMTDIAMGADVTAGNSNAGGLVGYLLEGSTTSYTDQTITGAYISGSVTSLNNVGGIIGYIDTSIAMTSSNLKGVIVATELTSMGTVNPIMNYVSGNNYQSGLIAVWDNMLINGVTAENYYTVTETDKTTGESVTSPSIPSGITLVTAEEFLLDSFYSSYGMSEYDSTYLITDVTEVPEDLYTDETGKYTYALNNIYMPGITEYIEEKVETDEVLDNTLSYNGESAGIVRPTPGENAGATVTYTSGINTINIESTQDMVTIQMGTEAEYTYTFQPEDKMGDTYNIITLEYDFKSDIIIDGQTYTSEDFIIEVMTYGSMWFYIYDGSLYYGGNSSTSATENTDIIDPVHMWQGKLLTSDGTIYAYSTGWSVVTDSDVAYKEVTVETGEGDAITSTSTSYEDQGILATALPLYDSTNYDTYYNFSIGIDGTYYGYRILSSGSRSYAVFTSQGASYSGYVLSTVSDTNYYALVSEESGKLISYAAAMSLGSFKTTEIAQLTNSYQYTGQVMIAQYDNGSIMVVNYTTGTIISDTSTFTQYAMSAFSLLANSFTGNTIDTDDSYSQSNSLLDAYALEDGTGTGSENSVLATGDSAAAEGEQAQATEDTGTSNSADGTSDSDATEAGSSDSSEDESSSDNDSSAGNESEDSSEESEESGTSSDDSTSSNSSSSSSSSSSGESSASSGGTSSEDGSGTGVSGSVSSGEWGVSTEATYMIGYNAYTGKYEVFEASSISSTGTPITTSLTTEIEQEKAAAELEEAALAASLTESEFIINRLFKNTLSSDEKHGLILLGIMMTLGLVIIITMNAKVRNKKR